MKGWKHKLLECPTFWESIWNTFWRSKPFYRCPKCKKALHCYWDGNDIHGHGIDYRDDCEKSLNKD